MSIYRTEKIRDEETWEMVRRAWEGGETGASCAKRFDVGLANLWRRRASEGWERRREKDRPPEPLEGWERYAREKMEAFEARLASEREVALALLRSLRGEPMETAPLWHLGFIYAFRARELGDEVAAVDRERVKDEPWASAVWNPEGRLWNQGYMDLMLMRYGRDDWREAAGLPAGAAEHWP